MNNGYDLESRLKVCSLQVWDVTRITYFMYITAYILMEIYKTFLFKITFINLYFIYSHMKKYCLILIRMNTQKDKLTL